MFDESAVATPTDVQLAQYLATNKDAFQTLPRATSAETISMG